MWHEERHKKTQAGEADKSPQRVNEIFNNRTRKRSRKNTRELIHREDSCSRTLKHLLLFFTIILDLFSFQNYLKREFTMMMMMFNILTKRLLVVKQKTKKMKERINTIRELIALHHQIVIYGQRSYWDGVNKKKRLTGRLSSWSYWGCSITPRKASKTKLEPRHHCCKFLSCFRVGSIKQMLHNGRKQMFVWPKSSSTWLVMMIFGVKREKT